jgi:GGDEF domain-containing protein
VRRTWVGGAEFVVVLTQVRPDGAAHIDRKVLAKMRKPFRLNGRVLRVTSD